MSGRVTYTIEFIVGQALSALKSLTGAESAAANAAKGLGAATVNAEKAMAASTGAINRAGDAAGKLAARNKLAAESYNMMITGGQKAAAAEEKLLAAQLKREAKAKQGGSWTGRVTDAAAGLLMAQQGLHYVNAAVKQAADVDTLMRKISVARGGGPEGDRDAMDAYNKAFEMSGKFKNTTVAENLKIIDDLRANLPEEWHDVLGTATEPFVRLHSFFSAWEGGKHAGSVDESLKEVGIAIRSGELLGKMTGEDLAKHAKNLAIAKATFGDKFKLSEYFAAQKAASQALPGMSDQFLYVGFPALVQSLGTRAGVGLATSFQKIIGGVRLTQGTVGAWEDIGLVDPKYKGWKSKDLVGKDWIKGGTEFGGDPFLFMLNKILPALQKSGKVPGIDSQGLISAFNTGDTEKAAALLKNIDRTKLTQQLSALGYDRNAVTFMFENVARLAAYMRDLKNQLLAEDALNKSEQQFKDYGESLKEVGSQANRAWLALTGREFVPWVSQSLRTIAGGLSSLSETFKNNPWMGQAAGYAAAAGITVVMAKMLAFMSRITGLTAAVRLLGSAFTMLAAPIGRVLTGAMRLAALPPLGGALMVGAAIIASWEALGAAMQLVVDASKHGTLNQAVGVMGGIAATGIPAAVKDAVDVLSGAPRQETGMRPTYDYMGNVTGQEPMPPASGAAGSLANGAAQNVNVRTTLDPIEVKIPAGVTIHVTGTVNGPVAGSGNLPMSATAPRGQTMSEPAAPAVPK